MKFTRDTIRTILALLLVIIIVVATFAYGNAQRNKQQADNKAKVTETQTKADDAKTNDNEKSATVETPPVAAAPAADSSAPVAAAPTTIPQAGAETSYGIPLGIIAIAGYFYVRSRQRLQIAHSNS